MYDTIRNKLPWALAEIIIGNIIVGNYTMANAITLTNQLEKLLIKRSENTNGDGI